jgi:hypothetical protein
MAGIADYTLAIMLVTIHTNSASIYLSIDFAPLFLQLEKTNCRYVDKMHRSSIAPRILSAYMKAATQVHPVQTNRLFAKQ